jgi:hypothetical protein
MLIGFAIDEFMRIVRRDLNWKFAMGIGMLAALGAEGAFAVYHPAVEQNREAMTMFQNRVKDKDVIFVDGATYVQFEYYRTLLAYKHPIYLGNEHWACCATGAKKQATMFELKSFRADLEEAAKRASGQHLWLFLASGPAEHWSHAFVGDLNSTESVLARQGCRREERIVLSATLVEKYRCGS